MQTLKTSLSDGVSQLTDGTKQLSDGASALAEGADKLSDGGKALAEGAAKLEEGGKKVNDGMQKFRTEAVGKILDLYSSDIAPLTERIKVLTDMSAEYDSFSGHAEGTVSEVKFIYETAAIRKKDK